MSSAMRTFDAISQYLKTRLMFKPAGAASVADREVVLEKMCTLYKLYDVIYVEVLIAKAPIKIDSTLAKTLQKDFEIKEEITEIGLDEAKGDFYTVSKEGKKYLTTYSKGEQSIINMLLANF